MKADQVAEILNSRIKLEWAGWVKGIYSWGGVLKVETPLGPIGLDPEGGAGMRAKRLRVSGGATPREVLRKVERVAGGIYRKRERQANKPRTPIEAKVPVKAVNRRRRKRLHARNFGSEADIVRGMPCLFCGREPYGEIPITAAHFEKRRGMGGANGDRTYLGPACGPCHTWEEGKTIEEVEEVTGIDLRQELERVREHVAAVMDKRAASE